MLIVTTRPRKYTYLVRALDSETSVTGHPRPKTGWIEVEHNAENVEKMFYDDYTYYLEKLPRIYRVETGVELVYNVPEKDPKGYKTGRMTKLVVPAKTEMRVMWRDLKRELTYCDYGGTMVTVGRNSKHKYTVEYVLDDKATGPSDSPADAGDSVRIEFEEHAAS